MILGIEGDKEFPGLEVKNLGMINVISGRNFAGKSAFLKKLSRTENKWNRIFLRSGNKFYFDRMRNSFWVKATIDNHTRLALIDDFEAGIHHRNFKEIWDCVFKLAADGIQFFITSHSKECIEYFNKVAIENPEIASVYFRMEKHGSKTRAEVYTIEELNDALETGWEFR